MDGKDILKSVNGPKPQTILLSGSPGAGKTTFLENLAYQWSSKYGNFLKKSEENPKPEHTIVVYALATDLKRDIWASIESCICCKDEAAKKQLSHNLKYDESSAILLDALDEIRDHETLSNITTFIENNHKDGGPQILVSARTGLSQLPTKIIDRSLQLDGFTPEQGLKFIEVFISNHLKQEGEKKVEPLPYTSMNPDKPDNHTTERKPFQPEEVHGFMVEHKEEMNAILRNPLRVQITCGLAVEGVLKLDKDNTLKPLYLQKCLEKFILERETGGKWEVSPDERLNFYRLCLHGLLTGIQSFTQNDLKTFNVTFDSPYMAFFNTSQKIDESAAKATYYSFVHETFYEYFAVRCFEELPDGQKKAIILSVCAKDIMQNVQKMICQVLSQYETENTLTLALGLIRTILLVKDYDDSTSQVQDPLKLKPDIQKNLPEVSHILIQNNVDDKSLEFKVNCLWEKIESQFTEPSGELDDYWKDILSSYTSMEYAVECERDFSQKQWLYIMENSIYLLLPRAT